MSVGIQETISRLRCEMPPAALRRCFARGFSATAAMGAQSSSRSSSLSPLLSLLLITWAGKRCPGSRAFFPSRASGHSSSSSALGLPPPGFCWGFPAEPPGAALLGEEPGAPAGAWLYC